MATSNFRDEPHKVTYVCNRTGGKAALILEPRRDILGGYPFTTVLEVLKELQPHFSDPNKFKKIERQYNDLNQGSMRVADVITTAQLYAVTLGLDHSRLLRELPKKFNFHMKDSLDHLGFEFKTFEEMKAYVIRIDDARRHSREERDRGKETDRLRRQLFRKTSPVPPVPVRYSASIRRMDRSPRGTASGASEGLTCYTCSEKGHTSRVCPQKPSSNGLSPLTSLKLRLLWGSRTSIDVSFGNSPSWLNLSFI